MPSAVPDKDAPQTAARHVCKAADRRDWRGRRIGHAVPWKEPRDVQRHVRRYRFHEGGYRVHVFIGVILPRHDERWHLHMAASFVQNPNRTAHHAEIAANPLVVFLRASLQVYVRRIDERCKLFHHLLAGASVRDEDVEHPARMYLPRTVPRYARYKGARVSSTRIRSVLADGNVKDANAMLGRPFSAEASVVRGKGVGRRLGAGTLNLAVSLPVRRGVYVVDTQFGPGVANYGVAPTMGRLAWEVPVLEVHLLDREALRDAGNRVRLRVEFLSFMRPETVFASVEALRRQIAADVAAARAFMV